MQQQPIVVGLKLCQHAIVEESTHNVTLVNCFRRLSLEEFPAQVSFTVCFALTDGIGDRSLTLSVMSLADGEIVWIRSWNESFKDPLLERWFVLPVKDCPFPNTGSYQVG